MEAVQEGFDLRNSRLDARGVSELHRDLVQLHAFLFLAAGGTPNERLAKTTPGGGERDVYVVVQGLAGYIAGLRAFLFGAGFAHQADDLIVMGSYFYFLVQRVLIRKQALSQAVGNGANVILMDVVRVGNKAPAKRIQSRNLMVNRLRAHNLPGNFTAKKTDVFPDQAHGQHMANTGDRGLNAIHIL